MHYRLLLLTVTLLLAACSVTFAHKRKPPSPGVLCVWPDPIVFNLADDSWKVCFDIDHSISTSFAPTCTTVGELRHYLATRRSANP